MASSSEQNRNIHVSEHIWDGRDHPILKVRKSQFIPVGLDGVPKEILPHLELEGFTGIAHVCQFPLDLPVDHCISREMEARDTHFHLPPDECTITLQDISVLLGLRIDGRPVIAPIGGNYADIVEESLGLDHHV
ncbi:protein MAIN-LIKE 2-like [Abrus precatorius]|uniref:Protein MAIN-LIKE 2-like n=1 Tax=Abrus precatorius TaxID=3816 RepID=A0A8B8L0H6_ABRPR|nr:protein MAIN-LIKE 2-like [Abrus precatorius]